MVQMFDDEFVNKLEATCPFCGARPAKYNLMTSYGTAEICQLCAELHGMWMCSGMTKREPEPTIEYVVTWEAHDVYRETVYKRLVDATDRAALLMDLGEKCLTKSLHRVTVEARVTINNEYYEFDLFKK